jgi:general secretion pathway protein K
MVKHADQRGVALIFVLWLLVLLGTIVAAVASRTRSEAALLSSLRARTVARYAAESGILAAAARIEALLDSSRGMTQRISLFRRLDAHLASLRDLELGNARFAVAVVDLNARLDLNRADVATLRGLFRQFTTESRAEAVVAAVKQAPVRRLVELTGIAGLSDSLALAVAPYVTVWSDGMVNINSAPEPVLAALPGVGGAAARSLVMRRDAGEIFTSPDPVRVPGRPDAFMPTAAIAPVATALASLMPTRLMIVSRGWQTGHPLTREVQAVYAVVGPRLVLQGWQERDL